MLTKEQAVKISRWENHQQDLMKYGRIIRFMAKEDLAKIAKLSGRDNDFVNSLIPNNCVMEIHPKNYVVFWIQVKGWYGSEKDYVCFSPDTKEKKDAYFKIAKKYIGSVSILDVAEKYSGNNKKVNYFDY